MTSEKTLKEKIEELRKKKEQEEAMMRGESLFKNPNKTTSNTNTPVSDVTSSTEPTKKPSFLGNFLKSEILPIVQNAASSTAAGVISGEVPVSETAQSIKYSMKEDIKQRVRDEFESWVNRGLDKTINKKLPFDVRYKSTFPGSGPTEPPRVQGTGDNEPEWRKRARQNKMID